MSKYANELVLDALFHLYMKLPIMIVGSYNLNIINLFIIQCVRSLQKEVTQIK